MSGMNTYVVIHLLPLPAPQSLYPDGNQRQEALPAPNPKPRPKPSKEEPPGDSDRQLGLQEGGSSLTIRISLL